MVQHNGVKRAVLIEAEAGEVKPSKKQKITSQNELVQALLQLKQQEIPRANATSHYGQTTLCVLNAANRQRLVRQRQATNEGYAHISDDEEESECYTLMQCWDLVKMLKKPAPLGRPHPTASSSKGPKPLPMGKPLPPPPSFPCKPPAAKLVMLPGKKQ